MIVRAVQSMPKSASSFIFRATTNPIPRASGGGYGSANSLRHRLALYSSGLLVRMASWTNSCVTGPSRRRNPEMIVTNTETIAGYRIVEIKGLVQGNTVRAKHAGRDIAASLKNLVGGELKGYTELLTESRRQALERMLSQAQQLGANAVVNVRFTTSAVTAGAAELYSYGTAVVTEPVS